MITPRLMPLAILGLLGVAVLWVTRSNTLAPKTLPVLTPAEILSLGEGRKAILLNFWATWCEPCEREMPSLVELHRRYNDRGLRVVLVNLEDEAVAEKVAEFLARYQALDLGVQRQKTEGFFKALGLDAPSALPFTALIHAKKGPISNWLGERPLAEIELEVERILK